MKHLYLGLLLAIVCLWKPSYGQIPITAGTYFPPDTELTEDGVPILNRRYSRNDAVHYPGPQTLDHYSTLVNDPYVSTEDLASIISSRPRPRPRQRAQPRPRPQQLQSQTRPRPEFRSGVESYTGDRIRWFDRAPFYPSTPQVGSYTYVSGPSTSTSYQTPQDSSARYRSNSNTYTTRTYYDGNGNGNGDWEVADKSDNHVTYRRRMSSRQWTSSPAVQRFDTSRGQVSARVVDMRTDDHDDRRRGGDTRRQNYARPETRSLDYNPSVFPTNTRSSAGNANVDAYWQQRRQGTTSSWPSTSSGASNYYDRQQTYQSAQFRPAPRFEPNYPMLNDRETAARSGQPNTVVITV